MLHVALWEPEIPPNTGNIARICAATETRLHLIGRLGFHIDDRTVKRAGLDYWPHVDLVQHTTWNEFLAAMPEARIWLIDNPAERSYTQVQYQDGDVLVFGSETRGLPERIRTDAAERLLSIPMSSAHVRSLNLSNSVGIVLYEALRQIRSW